MKHALRAMSLFNWPESFDFAHHRGVLIELIEDARIEPTKLIFNPGERGERYKTASMRMTVDDIIAQAKPFLGFEFCRPIDGNYLNLESDMTWRTVDYGNAYMIANSPQKLTIGDLLRHISLFCKHVTPQYGMSVQMPDSQAVFFLSGAGTTDMSEEDSRRAAAIGYYRMGDYFRTDVYDRLIDIYELNVLNPAHLKREVFGQPLASWIRGGKRGELVEINSNVAAWLVPDDIRPLIRRMFFSHGLLEAEA